MKQILTWSGNGNNILSVLLKTDESEKVEFIKLETACGAPLYVLEMPHARSAASAIMVRVGSRDENWPQEAGLAHAFEHMVFRGNEKFETSEIMDSYLENVGGEADAWTCKEMTGYQTLIPADYFERGINYLGYLLKTPLFRTADIKTEMQCVVEEFNQTNDDPIECVYDLSDMIVYGNHPLGKSVLGMKRSLRNFRREDFLRFKEKFYQPNNLIFITVGRVEAEKVQEIWNSLFRESGVKTDANRPKVTEIKNRRKRLVVRKEVDQIHICLAALIGEKGISSNCLEIFKAMIGAGVSSPLFQELREKRGLCYSTRVFLESWTDQGTFSIYVGADPRRAKEAREAIFNVIAKNTRNEALFQKAKKFLIGTNLISYESPADVLENATSAMMFAGRPLSAEEYIEEIKRVTLEEMAAVAEKYLKPENFVETYVAPKNFRFK